MDVAGRLAVPYRSLGVGNHNFGFQIDGSFFDAFEGSPVKGGNARIEVEARRKASGMTLAFKIEGTAQVECDRCLEPLDLPIEWEGELPVKVDETRAGEYDGDVVYIAPGEEAVDIAQWVYESICLALPLIRVHGVGADGVSLCDPDMLERFKIVSQSEFDELATEEEQQTIAEKISKK
ncbi:MAG: DUF177 domain-containing protein [Rikenellaceae bacterium]|jgi:uncharacterized metal-binding protein YceD (DUF177 family)|nr:DUF177 domain-containing protein [Rikenellaceae bacterium]